MIPNVGNTSSYLRVLICDMARTILTEFENIVRYHGAMLHKHAAGSTSFQYGVSKLCFDPLHPLHF